MTVRESGGFSTDMLSRGTAFPDLTLAALQGNFSLHDMWNPYNYLGYWLFDITYLILLIVYL